MARKKNKKTQTFDPNAVSNKMIASQSVQIDTKNLPFSFMSFNRIQNASINAYYLKRLRLAAISAAALFITYSLSKPSESWLLFMAFIAAICFFVFQVKEFFWYISSSVPVSLELAKEIDSDIQNAYGTYCYPDGGMYFLKNYLIGTQGEFDFFAYKDIERYELDQTKLLVYGKTGDFHIFKFPNITLCEDAYNALHARITSPSIDYQDSDFTGNPKQSGAIKAAFLLPERLRKLNCSNISKCYAKKVIKNLAAVTLTLLFLAVLLSGDISLFSNRPLIAVFLIIYAFLFILINYINLAGIKSELSLINDDELDALSRELNSPDVKFSYDYSLYILKDYLIYFGRDFHVIDIANISNAEFQAYLRDPASKDNKPHGIIVITYMIGNHSKYIKLRSTKKFKRQDASKELEGGRNTIELIRESRRKHR